MFHVCDQSLIIKMIFLQRISILQRRFKVTSCWTNMPFFFFFLFFSVWKVTGKWCCELLAGMTVSHWTPRSQCAEAQPDCITDRYVMMKPSSLPLIPISSPSSLSWHWWPWLRRRANPVFCIIHINQTIIRKWGRYIWYKLFFKEGIINILIIIIKEKEIIVIGQEKCNVLFWKILLPHA